MSGRRHDDPDRRGKERHGRGEHEGRRHPRSEHEGPPAWRAGDPGHHRGPPRHEHPEHHARPGRDSHRSDWDARRDFEHPSRDLDRDRDYRTLRGDRDSLDYEIDRDFGDAARALDRAHEYGRDFDRDREMDRRARHFDPERIARRPGYSPSGTFRALDEDAPRRHGPPDDRGGAHRASWRDAPSDSLRRGDVSPSHSRHGPPDDRGGAHRGRWRDAPSDSLRRGDVGPGHSRQGRRGADTWDEPEAWMDELRELRPRERPAEADVRLGGTQPSGHGPGVENMAPPRVGFSTSATRADDHDLGHGGYAGGPIRPRAPQGRGPRGYQRGDDRIRADICDRLMQEWMDASDVGVQVQDGVVTLAGSVRSRDEKRAIEDVTESVLGVKEVLNHLRLHRSEGVARPPTSQAPLQVPDDDGSLHS
ncbi:BON domain-containing protein [Myxococcus faecalis]|uniref:BON domain-containing protein n=1 Tax=Myxococcus TaxID=32 RepID=UPI001CBFA4A5|nr:MULTISPECIES: BON domain-containing protein [unclassified Myxococcus]MBZ4401666.1 BON domain-containing protein [Myxococcus sp. AS-1-15]MBZ4409391.1 BON domain-containing protein [Myxococcus sp. XM-1-1-1]